VSIVAMHTLKFSKFKHLVTNGIATSVTNGAKKILVK
jgi:hypothetical protein